MAKMRSRVTGKLATIDIPLADDKPGYCQRHVDARLSPKQAETLRAIRFGLDGKKMANGRYVESAADAVRWILDQIPLFLNSTRPNDPNDPGVLG